MKKTRRRDNRGAALVEAAIVMVPLCLIIFGIIEFGFIFKDSLSISNATRAGARTASAEPTQATFYPDTVAAIKTAGTGAKYTVGDTLWIYDVNAATNVNPTGTPTGPSGTDPCTSTNKCVEWTWSGSDWTTTASGGPNYDTAVWNSANRNVCLGSANGPDAVGIRLQVTHHSITGFFVFLNNLKLTERTVMRLEPQQSATSGSCS